MVYICALRSIYNIVMKQDILNELKIVVLSLYPKKSQNVSLDNEAEYWFPKTAQVFLINTGGRFGICGVKLYPQVNRKIFPVTSAERHSGHIIDVSTFGDWASTSA